jgi:hypothetical protein
MNTDRHAVNVLPGRVPPPMLNAPALSDDELRFWIQRMRRLIWQHSAAGASLAASQRLAHHRARLVVELDRLRSEAAARHI